MISYIKEILWPAIKLTWIIVVAGLLWILLMNVEDLLQENKALKALSVLNTKRISRLELDRQYWILLFRYYENQSLDPKVPTQAYLQRFYDLNKGPNQVKFSSAPPRASSGNLP
jgi:hypothetical protein